MDLQLTLLISFAGTVALSLIIGAWGRRKSSGSLVGFFWGDNNLTAAQGTHLNLSTSFAINGIVYSAWLGYIGGWASVLPQLVWCGGFLFLAKYARRLGHLSRTGTLHGNIGYVFGERAAKLAALASIIGFTLLFGWELYIGSSMFKAVMQSQSATLETILYLSLGAIGAIYCMLGGLRGNLHANQVQNYLSGGAVLLAIGYLWWFAVGSRPFAWADFVDYSSLTALATELTFVGMITNFVLFICYQFVDMSVWQNTASVSGDEAKPKRMLMGSAFWILFFPGVTGTALGMLMRSYEGVTANNIIPMLVQQTAAEPVIFVLLVAGFFAMMLSTVDGLLLAACQAVTWDVTDRKKVLRILTARGGPDFASVEVDEPARLAAKLIRQDDPLSAYIRAQVGDRLEPAGGSAHTDPSPAALAQELNSLLSSSELLDNARAAQIPLRPQIEELARMQPSGDNLRLLNRWILEDAYPRELSYSQFSNTLSRERAYSNPNWALSGGELKETEAQVLDHARYAILALAVVGGTVTLYLLREFEVNAFNLLYITYVAQMALFPAIWVIINGETKLQPRGAASIGFGLLAGFAATAYGLIFHSTAAVWAPSAALAVAALIYWPFRRVRRQAPETQS